VGDCVEPVITRDEFRQSSERQELYKELVNLENDIKSALDEVISKQRVAGLEKLENVIGGVVQSIRKDDIKLERKIARNERDRIKLAHIQYIEGNPSDNVVPQTVIQVNKEDQSVEDEKHDNLETDIPSIIQEPVEPKAPKPKDENSPKPQSDDIGGISVSFVVLNEHGGSMPRYVVVDQDIQINTAHPDFDSRLKSNFGKPKFTDRLCAYLASIVSVQYNDKMYEDKHLNPSRAEMYDDFVTTYSRIEAALQRKLPSLQRNLASSKPGVIRDLDDNEDYDDDESKS